MPKATPVRWRYCPHFKPLTIHCEFPPERALTPPPLTQHRVFSQDADSVQPIVQSIPAAPEPCVSAGMSSKKIQKPRGEVSRISRGGYNLQETLGWSSSEYEEIRVSGHRSILLFAEHHITSHLQSFVVHLAREYLKVNQSWKKQSRSSLILLYEEVCE